MTKEEIIEIKKTNYALVAQPHTNYWFAVSSNKLTKTYIDKFGENFNLIIYSGPDKETDYYVLPFKYIKQLFKEEYYSKDAETTTVGKRWVGNIKNHVLKITNNPHPIDVKEFFANPYFITENLEDELNDYEIENKRQEINVRINQSKFRKGVLSNFNFSCCISGITEENLLVASHIIPWAEKKETRLDPLNGLCLSVLYDKLFDKGYFTLTDNLEIITVSNKGEFSQSLTRILNDIEGFKITEPNKTIKKEYLEHHRTKIFIEREVR